MEPIPAAAPPPFSTNRMVRGFGYRNVAFLLFTLLMVPFGMVMEASGPAGPDRGGGIWAVLLLWGLGSAVFVLANVVLLIVALGRGRPAGAPLIAIGLPPGIVFGALVLEPLFVR